MFQSNCCKVEPYSRQLTVSYLQSCNGSVPFIRLCGKWLKDAGFSVFLTANNHAADCYSKGIKRTIDVLDSLGVYHTGTFKNSLEHEQDYPLIIEKNGIRMVFLNYTYDTNGINVESPYIVI